MPLSDAFEKLGRAIFETPFGANRIAKDAPELAEIRLAVLEAAKNSSHRAGGQHVFPYNLVRITLLGIADEQSSVFKSDFLHDYLAEELRATLKRSSFRFPPDLDVELMPEARMPGPNEKWLAIEMAMKPQANLPEPSQAGPPPRLKITAGTANYQEVVLDKPRLNIGRIAEVFTSGGPLRRNDLVFGDDNPINKTVSREHAHIVRSAKTGECRIFNDRVYRGNENSGIWIVRNGLSQPVHRNSRGTLLKNGDEIHLGDAILFYEQ
jgi:hypothetical protein